MSTDALEPSANDREVALLRQLAAKDEMILQQAQLIEKLAERIARLERDSDDSNSPPSSDSPFKDRKKSGRNGKPGAKPGHKAVQRTPFPPERVDEQAVHDFPEGQAPAHFKPVEGKNAWVTFQQITRLKAVVTEHRVRCYHNTLTGKVELAPHPKRLGKLLGPEAAAAVAWLKTKGHMAILPMRDFFRDILDARISAGCLSQAVTEVGKAAKAAWEEVRSALSKEPVVGFDETSHRDSGWLLWMWVAQTKRLSLFRIGNTRSADELDELLPPGWLGIMVRDRFTAYVRWAKGKPGILDALCLAHLTRDIKSLLSSPFAEVADWAKRLLAELGGVWEAHQLGCLYPLCLAWSGFMRVVRATPFREAAEKLAKGIEKHEAGYTRFIANSAVPPTNNASEQALRQVVIHRKITQGTRGDAGIEAQERIWTVLDTARKQGLSALDYLRRAVEALREGMDGPRFLAGA